MRTINICETIIICLLLIFLTPLLGSTLGPVTLKIGVLSVFSYYLLGYFVENK